MENFIDSLAAEFTAIGSFISKSTLTSRLVSGL